MYTCTRKYLNSQYTCICHSKVVIDIFTWISNSIFFYGKQYISAICTNLLIDGNNSGCWQSHILLYLCLRCSGASGLLLCFNSSQTRISIDTSNLNTSENVAEFHEAFSVFDRDSNGFITTAELGTVMVALGQRPSLQELEALLNGIDTSSK